MYLTSLNPKTGLLEIEEGNDGILAIKEFRDLIQNKKLGLHCLTAIALTADYQSPILYYNDKDRPRKAQEEVTGDRDAYEWNTEIIQKALLECIVKKRKRTCMCMEQFRSTVTLLHQTKQVDRLVAVVGQLYLIAGNLTKYYTALTLNLT